MLKIEVDGEKDEITTEAENSNLYELLGAVQALKRIAESFGEQEAIVLKELFKAELDKKVIEQ